MATLNATAKGRMKTVNRSGHAAYKMDNRTKLVTMALTTMLGEKKYYGDNTNELIKLAADLCKSGDGEFVAKLAVWARKEGNLRSVSHALMAVVARFCSGDPTEHDKPSFVRKAARAIASMRGDDGTEMLASYWTLYGKDSHVRVPNALRRGIRDAIGKESPYQIAKYQSASKEVKLRDVLRMTHPVPKDQAASDAMGECISGSLNAPEGWETELSARGNTKEVWDDLISKGKVPYMACLRNLRNMIQAGADIDPVLEKLTDPAAVAKSRQLPFRFYSAYRQLGTFAGTKVARALDKAMVLSCDNLDHLQGRTAVLIDTSGSMRYQISSRSDVLCCDIAAVLGAIATHISDNAIVVQFNTDASVVPMFGLSILSDAGCVPRAGGGTYMSLGFDKLSESGFDANRIIILSDNEVNGGLYGYNRSGNQSTIQAELDEYRKKVGHDVWCHAIDLQGYGTQQFIGPHVNVIAGWSESVLRFISMAESGIGGIVDEIEGYSL